MKKIILLILSFILLLGFNFKNINALNYYQIEGIICDELGTPIDGINYNAHYYVNGSSTWVSNRSRDGGSFAIKGLDDSVDHVDIFFYKEGYYFDGVYSYDINSSSIIGEKIIAYNIDKENKHRIRNDFSTSKAIPHTIVVPNEGEDFIYIYDYSNKENNFVFTNFSVDKIEIDAKWYEGPADFYNVGKITTMNYETIKMYFCDPGYGILFEEVNDNTFNCTKVKILDPSKLTTSCFVPSNTYVGELIEDTVYNYFSEDSQFKLLNSRDYLITDKNYLVTLNKQADKTYYTFTEHNHSTVSECPSLEPTYTYPGYKSCFYCEDCGFYFEDEDCLNYIGDENDLNNWKLNDGKIDKIPLPSGVSLIIRDENKAIIYKGDECVENTIDYVNVETDTNKKEYLITFSRDINLSSIDDPVIEVLNDYNATFKSNNSLNIQRKLSSSINKTDYIIYGCKNITFDSLDQEHKFTIIYNEERSEDLSNNIYRFSGSSFIYAGFQAKLLNTNLTCTNYCSCIRTDSYIYVDNNSTVNHHLIPSLSGEFYSLYSNNNISIQNNSHYNANIIDVTKGYSITFNGVFVRYYDLIVDNNSHFKFSGNPYCNSYSYGIYCKSGICLSSDGENLSSIDINDICFGVITPGHFENTNSNLNIVSQYGSILADNYISFYYNPNCYPEYFNIQKVTNRNQDYDFKFYDTVLSFHNPQAIFAKNSYNMQISESGYMFKGSLDDVSYYDINNTDLYTKDQYLHIILDNKPIPPNPLTADLSISYEPGKCLLYSDGIAYGLDDLSQELKEKIVVEPHNDENYYLVKFLDNITLSAGAEPVIRTNNNKSLRIQSDHKLELNCDLSNKINNYVIYSDNQLRINSISNNAKFAIIYKSKADKTIQKNLDIVPSSSFIYSNNDLIINNTFIDCTNYFSCLTSNSSIRIDNNSDIVHSLLVSIQGYVNSAIANSSITIDNSSNYTAEINKLSSKSHVSFSGLSSLNSSVFILNGSKYSFTGNMYLNKEKCFAIKAKENVEIKSFLNNSSTIEVSNSTVGVVCGSDFVLSNSNASLICDYGAILANNNIVLEYNKFVPSVFSIMAKSEELGFYSADFDDQPTYFEDIKAIKSNSENYDVLFNSCNLVGSVDRSEFINVYEDSSNEMYDYYEFKTTERLPTADDGDLIINTTNGPTYFIEDEPHGSVISNIDIDYDSESETYTLTLLDDVTIECYNKHAIYTRNDKNLKIVGNHNLDININCYSDTDLSCVYGIKSEGDLQIGEKEGTNNPVIHVYDDFAATNYQHDYLYCEVAAIVAFGEINIYNSKIIGDVSTSLILGDENKITIDHSELIHNIYANAPSIQSNLEIYTLAAFGPSIDIINESRVTSNFSTDFISESCTAYNGILCLDLNVEDSNLNINCPENIGFGYDDFFYASIVYGTFSANDSIIKANNFKMGYVSLVEFDFENCDITINNVGLCFASYGSFNVTYNDDKKHIFDIKSTNEGEIDLTDGSVCPCFVFYDESDNAIVPTSDNVSFTLSNPSSYMTTDIDKIYNVENNNKYRHIQLIYDEKEPEGPFDLIINNDSSKTYYFEGDLIEGEPIDNLYVSFINNTYTFNVSGDVEINSFDDDAIYLSDKDLKIVGNDNLTINLKCFDEDFNGYVNGIYCDGSLTIGDENSDDKVVVLINDDYSIHNYNQEAINSYTFGIYTENDFSIYNSKLIGNVTCDLVVSNQGNINVKNSDIIHNIYANYLYPGFYRNEAGQDFKSLIAKDTINFDKSSCICDFAGYNPGSNIFYYGIECDSFIINESDINLNNFTSFDDEDYNPTNSSTISANELFKATNSNITLNNFLMGIGSNNIFLENNNINIKCFGPCLYANEKITIKQNKDDLLFNVESVNKGEISVIDSVYPAMFIIGDGGIAEPTKDTIVFDIKDTLQVKTDVDYTYDVKNNNKYRLIKIVSKEVDPIDPVDPVNPSHKDDDHGHSSDKHYNIPKTGIR